MYDSAMEFEEIVNGLQTLDASKFDLDNEDADGKQKLSELTDASLLLPSPERIIPELFKVIERLPDSDLGSPGPIVHTLEKMRGSYEAHLLESVRGHPTVLSVWMVNRILNTALSPESRGVWMAVLEDASKHSLANEETRESALNFIDHQKQKA